MGDGIEGLVHTTLGYIEIREGRRGEWVIYKNLKKINLPINSIPPNPVSAIPIGHRYTHTITHVWQIPFPVN